MFEIEWPMGYAFFGGYVVKRFFSSIVLVFLILSSLLAGDVFSFSPVASSPLYKESISDPYAFTTRIHLMNIPKAEDNEFRINALVKDETTGKLQYDNFFYRDPRSPEKNLYLNMKLSGNASLFRVRYSGNDTLPSVDLDVNLLGYINTIFWLSGSTDTLDFDGSYQASLSLRVADSITMRFGIHHFSGHYGDETLGDFYAYNKIDFNNGGRINNYTGDKGVAGHDYTFLSATEYVRDNSWIIGLQAELPYGFRLYGQCEIPQKDAWIRPFVHVPADYINPGSGDPNDESSIHRSGGSEGAREEDGLIDKVEAQKRGSGYMALRVHGGVEYTLPLSWADIVLSCDVQAHQDGQNRNSSGEMDILSYNPGNMWEFEITAGGALILKDEKGVRNVRVEAFWHTGRTTATQWFYKRGSFIYVGLGLN